MTVANAQRIDRDEFKQLTRPVVGLPVSRAWRGYGSAELVVGLSGGRWVHSFTTVEGQPEWALKLPGGRWISVKRGKLHVDG